MTTAITRIQFSFNASDKQLRMVLRRIAAMNTNVSAIVIYREKINNVQLVVGPDASNSPQANQTVRQVLGSLGIRFSEKRVLQVTVGTVNVPGSLSRLYSALSLKVKVNILYFNEIGDAVIDVSDLAAAKKVIMCL